MIIEKKVSNVNVDILDKNKTLIEMEDNDIRFLVDLIRKYKPKNVLEIGVSAGGSSYYILRELKKNSKLTSIDTSKTYYRDSSKEAGFVVEQLMGIMPPERWTKYFGYDIIEIIDQLRAGKPFDFVLIDADHVLPSEFLSFLAVLPLTKKGTPIILHDIFLNYHYMITWKSPLNPHRLNCYCTGLLLSCVSSKRKEMPEPFCNIGMFTADRITTENIMDVIHALYMPWHQMPSEELLNKYQIFIKNQYGELCSRYFDDLLTYERAYFAYKKQ